MGDKVIKNFSDLYAWKEAYKLTLKVYKLLKKLPKDETYILVDQMKRCAVSVCSNIAEGFSRKSSKEKIQFYYLSHGSLTELQNQLIISRGLGYITIAELKGAIEQTIVVQKLINGLIRKLISE